MGWNGKGAGGGVLTGFEVVYLFDVMLEKRRISIFRRHGSWKHRKAAGKIGSSYDFSIYSFEGGRFWRFGIQTLSTVFEIGECVSEFVCGMCERRETRCCNVGRGRRRQAFARGSVSATIVTMEDGKWYVFPRGSIQIRSSSAERNEDVREARSDLVCPLKLL